MIDDLLDNENVRISYESTQKSKSRFKRDAIKFARNPWPKIDELVEELRNGSYQPSGYTEFLIKEPKERIIYAPYYRDKIVHHMINNVLRDHCEPLYIKDSYACIRGKGQLACIEAIQKHLRVASRNFRNPYIIKTDISKFFYSIDRVILKRIVKKQIRCSATFKIISSIIDSSPTEKGLPLGNLTSQQLANIYLNEIDQYCKRTLSLKHYIRYADDFCIIVDGKEEARRVLSLIRNRVDSELGLLIPVRKCIVKPLAMGFHGLGVKIYTTHVSLNSRTKRRFERYCRNLSKSSTMLNSQRCCSIYAYASNFRHHNFTVSMLSKYRNLSHIKRKKTIKRIAA